MVRMAEEIRESQESEAAAEEKEEESEQKNCQENYLSLKEKNLPLVS